VAKLRAELAEAEFYLDNCTMVAPEDGYVINLQVRPGMVAGDIRFGAIASFVVDAGRYLLVTYTQENLKYVREGQYVEVAFDLYPGQIFKGKVKGIWQGTGQGQMLPSGTLPTFNPPPPDAPQGLFAVQVHQPRALSRWAEWFAYAWCRLQLLRRKVAVPGAVLSRGRAGGTVSAAAGSKTTAPAQTD
jgi:hypothetical protein